MERYLAIIELLSAHQALTPRELQERVGIPPATLNRMLKEMVADGVLGKSGHGRYRLAARMLDLGARILDHAMVHLYLPMLKRLAEVSGLNAELYSLTGEGPTLINWVRSRSHFQVRMFPGYRVSHAGHPAVTFYLLHHPCATVWGLPVASLPSAETTNEWLELARSENFLLETGHVRPELARAGTASADGRLAICLSGLGEELSRPGPDQLHQWLQQAIDNLGKELE